MWCPTPGGDAIWLVAPSRRLLARYLADRVAANHVFVLEELRRRVEMERDRLSREVFRSLLESGTMRFLVVTEDLDFGRIPAKIEVPKAKRANREDGGSCQRNLFDMTTEDDHYKRSVFDICSEHARKADWAEFAPAMRSKVMRFEVVDEDEWQTRLNGMLFGGRG